MFDATGLPVLGVRCTKCFPDDADPLLSNFGSFAFSQDEDVEELCFKGIMSHSTDSLNTMYLYNMSTSTTVANLTSNLTRASYPLLRFLIIGKSNTLALPQTNAEVRHGPHTCTVKVDRKSVV